MSVVLKVVLNMDHDFVSPIGLNRWSRILAIESQNLTLPTIWSQSDIVDRKIVLPLAEDSERTNFNSNTRVRSHVIIVGVYVVLSPALSICRTVDTRGTRCPRGRIWFG